MDKERCLRESPMSNASKALQALVHNANANPVARNESADSNTILRSPNLHTHLPPSYFSNRHSTNSTIIPKNHHNI